MAVRAGAPATPAAPAAPVSIEREVPRAPRLGTAVRQAAGDLYFNSWRLVPANLLWTAVLLLVLFLGLAYVPFFAAVAALAIPTAGIHRLAALIARGEPATFSDVVDGMRRHALAAAIVGLAAVGLAIVFTTNVVLGLQAGGVAGWSLATFAAYGDLALAMFLVAFWPVLTDPRREDLSIKRRITLAGLVVIGAPGRMLALTLSIMLLLVASTVVVGAIALVGIAFVSLLATRYVLPLLDHIEARLPR